MRLGILIPFLARGALKVTALNSSGASSGLLKSSFIRSLATLKPVNPPVATAPKLLHVYVLWLMFHMLMHMQEVIDAESMDAWHFAKSAYPKRSPDKYEPGDRKRPVLSPLPRDSLS